MEKPVNEKPVKAQKPKYEMPRPKVGSRVDWFPKGDKRTPHEAVVKEVYAEKIYCVDTTDGSFKICFHCDHPTANSDVPDDREIIKLVDGGTWDFKKDDIDLAAFKVAVEQRLADLEAAVRAGLGLKK